MNKMIKIKKAMVAFAAVLAMSLMLLPSVKADAAVTVLAAPKDAKQTISTETAVRVSWSAVPGATAYVYSYSSDNKTYTGEALTGNGGKDTFINLAGANWAAGNTYYVKVRAYDEEMKPFEIEGTELLARAFCHEIDHLDGHLYVEKVEGELMSTESPEQ